MGSLTVFLAGKDWEAAETHGSAWDAGSAPSPVGEQSSVSHMLLPLRMCALSVCRAPSRQGVAGTGRAFQ